MDQNAIIALSFVPFGLFWIIFLIEWKPAPGLKGNTRSIVEWLIGYTVQVASVVTLVFGLSAFLLSLVAFFGFTYLKTEGLIPWYFAIFLCLLAIEAVAVFLTKLFLFSGKRKNLLR